MSKSKQLAAEGWLKNKALIATGLFKESDLLSLLKSVEPSSETIDVTKGYAHIEKEGGTDVVPSIHFRSEIPTQRQMIFLNNLLAGRTPEMPFPVKISIEKDEHSKTAFLVIKTSGDYRANHGRTGGIPAAIDESKYMKYCAFRSISQMIVQSGHYDLKNNITNHPSPVPPQQIQDKSMGDATVLFWNHSLPHSEDIQQILTANLTGRDLDKIDERTDHNNQRIAFAVKEWMDSGIISNKQIATQRKNTMEQSITSEPLARPSYRRA